MSQRQHQGKEQKTRVQDLGEQEILKRLYAFCPTDVVGDDAALLSLAPDYCLVVTTDMLVDQVHFSDRTTHPSDVGWRAATANLSDLAAMGAEPLGITVSLGLPGSLPMTWVEELYQGLTDCLNQYHTAIVGGDVCRSSVTTVSITAFGQVHPHRILKRTNAKPGQAILVTGVHGASRAGLELLLHPEIGQELDPASRDRLIQSHQRPRPRLDVLPVIEWRVGSEERGERREEEREHREEIEIAAMDSSDGLADAVVQICRASGVGAVLERDRLPISADLKAWVATGAISEAEAIDWVLYGGEDFELVICLPPKTAEAVVSQLGGETAIVGRITADQTIILTDPTGTYSDDRLGLERGFQHFI